MRQPETGLSGRDILRKLKRATAREICRLLTTPIAVPGVVTCGRRDRPNITLTVAANHLGV